MLLYIPVHIYFIHAYLLACFHACMQTCCMHVCLMDVCIHARLPVEGHAFKLYNGSWVEPVTGRIPRGTEL
jgi:hypothetical protein